MTQLLSSRKVSAMQMSENFPNGATITPVDDYIIWLRCAELPNIYGSLANVIADNIVMETLCNNLNALRYMVRSEDVIMSAVLDNSDWVSELDACAYAVHTPTMTTNTLPSGTASASSGSSTEAYKSFDKNSSTYHVTGVLGAELGQYIQYAFAKSIHLYKYTILAGNGVDGGFQRVKLYGSTNGSEFNDLGWSSGSVPFNTLSTFKQAVPNAYKYFKVANGLPTNGTLSNTSFYVFELDFYGLDLS